MVKPRLMALLILLLGGLLPAIPVQAQDGGACPAVVAAALESLAASCAATARDQACYAHAPASALMRVPGPALAAPGDVVPLGSLARLQTAALDPASGDWGVVLLRAQVDQPDERPGQNVTLLLLGEVTLTDAAGPPLPPIAEPATCLVAALASVNLRAGPGTDYDIAGGAAEGQALTVIGQNGAGDWLRLQDDPGELWVFAELTDNFSCAFETVPVMQPGSSAPLVLPPPTPAESPGEPSGDAPDEPPGVPFAALTLVTGPADPACAEALPNALLIHTPAGATAHLTVNGVDLAISGAASLTAPPPPGGAPGGSLSIDVLAGVVGVTVDETLRQAPSGFRLEVPLDADGSPAGPPSDPAPLDPIPLAAYADLPGIIFEDRAALPAPAAGTISRWTVTAEIIQGGAWQSTGTRTETSERVILHSPDGALFYRGRRIDPVDETHFAATHEWVFQGTPTVGVYEFTYTSLSTFLMDWTVTAEGAAPLVFQDIGIRRED